MGRLATLLGGAEESDYSDTGSDWCDLFLIIVIVLIYSQIVVIYSQIIVIYRQIIVI